MAYITNGIGGMILHPIKTVRTILLGKPFGLSQLIFCGFLASAFLAQWFSHAELWIKYPLGFVQMLPFQLIVSLFAIFIFAGIIHLSADMLGGGGRAINAFYLMQIALLPFWLFGPLATALNLLNLTGYNWILAIALGCWSCLILIISIAELYRFDAFRALLTIIIPAGMISLLAAAAYFGSSLLPAGFLAS